MKVARTRYYRLEYQCSACRGQRCEYSYLQVEGHKEPKPVTCPQGFEGPHWRYIKSSIYYPGTY